MKKKTIHQSQFGTERCVGSEHCFGTESRFGIQRRFGTQCRFGKKIHHARACWDILIVEWD